MSRIKNNYYCQNQDDSENVVRKRVDCRKENENEPPVVIRLSALGIFEKTAEQVDLQIQIERVMRIFDDTIEKLKIAACLPAFLKNHACLLRKHCNPNDVEYVKRTCYKYKIPDYFSEVINTRTVQEMSVQIDNINANQAGKIEKKPSSMIDPHIARVLELLWNNNAVKEKALQNYENIVEDSAKTLISCVKNVKRIAQKKLPQTADEEAAREKLLKKMWQENQDMEEQIKELSKDVEEQQQFYQKQVDEKQFLLTEAESVFDQLQKDSTQFIKKTTKDSEDVMAQNGVLNKQALDKLNQEANSTVQQYEALRVQHLKEEQKLRQKRLKVLAQLTSWLNKYDDDMTERQRIYDEYKQAYDDAAKEIAEFQETFDIQEEEYDEMMREKTAEERQILEKKLDDIARNHAARVLQKYWRLYLIEHPKQKGKKKGKGKGKGKRKKK